MDEPNPPLCWFPGPATSDGVGTCCILPEGHDGPHVPDRWDNVLVALSDIFLDPEARNPVD